MEMGTNNEPSIAFINSKIPTFGQGFHSIRLSPFLYTAAALFFQGLL